MIPGNGLIIAQFTLTILLFKHFQTNDVLPWFPKSFYPLFKSLPILIVSSKVTDSKKTIFSGVIKPFTNMKKSIVGQIRRSFFSHDQKSADHATFDKTINIQLTFDLSSNLRSL
jgi:hypothetical protein